MTQDMECVCGRGQSGVFTFAHFFPTCIREEREGSSAAGRGGVGVGPGKNSGSVLFVSALICSQELRGRQRGPFKMGHRLSALQQKLNPPTA